MTNNIFNKIVKEQLNTCNNLLVKKGKEYAVVDRLDNFNIAAKFQGITRKQALLGMATKHFASISSMIHYDVHAPIEVWNEKISDAINYLILLKALVIEENYE